jgi:hypothetical protein
MRLPNDRGKSIKFHFIYFIRISSFRGFGFITFKEANSVDKVLAKDVHMLDEKQVEFIKHRFE